MTKPQVVIDPHWRRLDELFSHEDFCRLETHFEIVWGSDEPMPKHQLDMALESATAYVSAAPYMDAKRLAKCPNLKVIVEVAGAFPDTIDYQACSDAGVEVLCCAPGFRKSVAEMVLAMTLGSCRGLVEQDRAFRRCGEAWLEDFNGRDFTLFGAELGFVGYGQIAKETHRLFEPFAPKIRVFDPYLPDAVATNSGVEKTDLSTLLTESQILIVAAAPTAENRAMLGRDEFASMRKGALLVLISRAHLVDFEALRCAVERGHIQAAIDVYPSEPLAVDDSLRNCEGVILSPHRAAAVPNGRQLIGKLLTDDLLSIAAGGIPSELQRANLGMVAKLAGVGDANKVGVLASNRK